MQPRGTADAARLRAGQSDVTRDRDVTRADFSAPRVAVENNEIQKGVHFYKLLMLYGSL